MYEKKKPYLYTTVNSTKILILPENDLLAILAYYYYYYCYM